MQANNSVLFTGPSGIGKSTLIRGALEYYGSGAVVLCPGTDELDSYIGLNGDNYTFKGFDDTLFHPELKEWEATGHADMVKWLKQIYTEVKSDVDANKPPRYAVLGVDTESAVGRMAYNVVMAKYKMTEPPPAQSPNGAAFYSSLRLTLESSTRVMRAIRGLGVHWIVAAHPTESGVTAIQQVGAAKEKIMMDLPGGFKNIMPSFFNTVLHIGMDEKRVRFAQWDGDPKKVTKSRLGPLGGVNGKIPLPIGSKAAWTVLATALDDARAKLGEGK